MSQAAEFRRRAAEDEAMARLMTRNDYRDYFLQEARHWRALAASAQEREGPAAQVADDGDRKLLVPNFLAAFGVG
jgi:hypothetical protein